MEEAGHDEHREDGKLPIFATFKVNSKESKHAELRRKTLEPRNAASTTEGESSKDIAPKADEEVPSCATLRAGGEKPEVPSSDAKGERPKCAKPRTSEDRSIYIVSTTGNLYRAAGQRHTPQAEIESSGRLELRRDEETSRLENPKTEEAVSNCPGRCSNIDDPNWAKSTSNGGAPGRAMPTMEAAGPDLLRHRKGKEDPIYAACTNVAEARHVRLWTKRGESKCARPGAKVEESARSMPSKEHEESMSAECCGGEEGPGKTKLFTRSVEARRAKECRNSKTPGSPRSTTSSDVPSTASPETEGEASNWAARRGKGDESS